MGGNPLNVSLVTRGIPCIRHRPFRTDNILDPAVGAGAGTELTPMLSSMTTRLALSSVSAPEKFVTQLDFNASQHRDGAGILRPAHRLMA